MIGVLGHDSALQGYTRPGTSWTNEMNFVINHAPGAGFSSTRYVHSFDMISLLNIFCFDFPF